MRCERGVCLDFAFWKLIGLSFGCVFQVGWYFFRAGTARGWAGRHSLPFQRDSGAASSSLRLPRSCGTVPGASCCRCVAYASGRARTPMGGHFIFSASRIHHIIVVLAVRSCNMALFETLFCFLLRESRRRPALRARVAKPPEDGRRTVVQVCAGGGLEA